MNPTPWISTTVPGGPLPGEKPVTDNDGAKSAALEAVPAPFATDTFPETAPSGTVASMRVSDTTENAGPSRSPNFTLVAPLKSEPLIVTTLPVIPEPGENELIDGGCSIANAHAAPPGLLAHGRPISAVFPSPDKRNAEPCWPGLLTAPVPTSFGPGCDHVDPERVKTHVAPVKSLSLSPRSAPCSHHPTTPRSTPAWPHLPRPCRPASVPAGTKSSPTGRTPTSRRPTAVP